MSNTNYKLICKYAGDYPLTVNKPYSYECYGSEYHILCDDDIWRIFYDEKISDRKFKNYFDLVPVDATPDPIMVQPADYIDPKLLEAYNALDENGKAIMQKTWPDVRWPNEVRYVNGYNWLANQYIKFEPNTDEPSVVYFDNCTPEINDGEIRFKINEP
jgi:hypothetical protein